MLRWRLVFWLEIQLTILCNHGVVNEGNLLFEKLMYKRHDVSINYPHPHRIVNIELIVTDRKRQRVDHIETLIRKKVGRNRLKNCWQQIFFLLTYWSDLEVQPIRLVIFLKPTFFTDIGLCHHNHHNHHHHNLLTWSTFLRGTFTVEVTSANWTWIVLKYKRWWYLHEPRVDSTRDKSANIDMTFPSLHDEANWNLIPGRNWHSRSISYHSPSFWSLPVISSQLSSFPFIGFCQSPSDGFMTWVDGKRWEMMGTSVRGTYLCKNELTCCSQGSKQSLWNICVQGNLLTSSPKVYGHWQTAQSALLSEIYETCMYNERERHIITDRWIETKESTTYSTYIRCT